MAFVALTIPVLVQDINIEEKPHYYIRPLFLSFPVATNYRFELAVGQFKKEIKNYFKGFILNRQSADRFLWYLFCPEIQYKQYYLKFNIGKQFIEGNFGVAYFKLQGFTFVCFPRLSNFMFIAAKDKNGKVNLQSQIEKAAQKKLREIRDEAPSDFVPESYFSSKKDFFTTIKVNINIGNPSFRFEQSPEQLFFSRLMGDSNFDGSVEIEKVGFDLNSLYPTELRRAFYQETLVKKISQILFNKENTPIALVGPKGVGKHTIIQEVVWRYQSDFYSTKKGRVQRIWHIDPTRIITGMSVVGMWQKRFEAILKYARKPSENSDLSDKLLIDNAVALIRIGKSASNSMTLADVLKPYLEKRQLQLTILASPEEWKIIQEKNRRFTDLFQVTRLQEPELEIATKIVLQQRKALELKNGITFTIQAINQLFTIQRNYLKNTPLPGSVMKLMQQLAVKYRFRRVDAPEVRQEFKDFSGLEERIFDASHQFEANEVDKIIGQELVGQPSAVQILADVVHLIKAKLTDKTKPLSSFLFIGPTGVGKTQAAKVLCKFLMGNEDQLMRFDMNEYIDEYAVQRLIGDYHNPEGQLTGKVRYQPFGILLLDEIEKAHPKVHDILLQVLDDGRLTDSLGRTVDFSNTIIIMTSNIGAKEASVQLGFKTDQFDESAVYRKAVENYFRPEFINRIDRIAIFNPLELDHILKIARLQIKELLQRDGFVRRTTILNISKDALEWVAKRGYDGRMGGRALKRQIERDLTTLSAEQLITTYNDNPIIFDISLENGRLRPHINTLDFVLPIEENWIPNLPDVSRGKRFYNILLRSIEKLETQIAGYEEDIEIAQEQMIITGEGSLNWQHFHFKDKVVEVKENIKTIMLGFRDNYFKEAPAIPLRLKRGHLIPRKDWGTKGIRENIKDRLFQQEALKEISEAYQFAAAQFDSLKSEFIENYLNVAFLKLFGKGFLKGKTDKVLLSFNSCITGLGDWEIKFLVEKYADFFKSQDIQHQISKNKKNISAEGHSLFNLLKGEAGIHLFYIAHQNPLPIKLEIQLEGQKNIPEQLFKVIRIYDGSNTLTDLRTGFSNAVNITASEFKLLLYAGIEPKLRNSLIRM